MLGTYGIGAVIIWPYLTVLGLFEDRLEAYHVTPYHVLYAMMSIMMFACMFISKWVLDAADRA